MLHRPNLIGPDNFALWTGYIELDPALSPHNVQDIVTNYVSESGITVVGGHAEQSPAFRIFRWPDNREGYQAPTLAQCKTALAELAICFGSDHFGTGIVPKDKIHVMMGRKKGGYGKGEVVPLDVLQNQLPDCTITPGFMISARTTDKGVESYGVYNDEEVGFMVLDHSQEQIIHDLGDMLEQHHYAIEHGPHNGKPGRTDFWETRWSPTYTMRRSRN